MWPSTPVAWPLVIHTMQLLPLYSCPAFSAAMCTACHESHHPATDCSVAAPAAVVACPPLHLPLPSSQRPSSFLLLPGEAGARGSEGGGEAGEEYGERRFVEHGEDVLHEGEVSRHGGESDEEAVAAGGLRAGAADRSAYVKWGGVVNGERRDIDDANVAEGGAVQGCGRSYDLAQVGAVIALHAGPALLPADAQQGRQSAFSSLESVLLPNSCWAPYRDCAVCCSFSCSELRGAGEVW